MTEQTMTLTRQPTPIVGTQAIPPFRLAPYGDGGSGKTTLALTFPHPLVIDTDGGLEGDAVDRLIEGDRWTPDGWQDMNAIYWHLKDQIEAKGYQTIVIDDLPGVCQLLLHEAVNMPTAKRPAGAAQHLLVSPEQKDYGKVASAVDILLNGQMKSLAQLYGVHIVVTSAMRMPSPEKGTTKRTFDVQGAVERIVTSWANVYGELEVIKKKNGEEARVLWTGQGDPIRKCKTRFAALRPGVTNPTYEKMRAAVLAGRLSEGEK